MYKVSIKPEEMEKMPMTAFQGEIQVIKKFGRKYLKAIDYLNKQQVIGFDTETRPTFSPGQKSGGVSLLQLSGADKAFLFRIKKLGMTPKLCRLMANEKIAKVGAATGEDVLGLQRYSPFKPAAFIDLQRIVWEYGIKDKSVKKMAAIILGIRISKTQQLSNWDADELSEAQQKYAATDAWVCREMYLKLLQSERKPLDVEEMLPNG